MCACFSHVQLFVTLRTVVLQVPLSIGFYRQDYWGGFPCLLLGIFPTHGSNPCLTHWQMGSSALAPLGKPTTILHFIHHFCCYCSVTKTVWILETLMDCSMPSSSVFHCPRVCSTSCSLSQWCYLTISSSVAPFSYCPQSFPESGLFQYIGSLNQAAKVLELQFQHQSFQWIFRAYFH